MTEQLSEQEQMRSAMALFVSESSPRLPFCWHKQKDLGPQQQQQQQEQQI